MWEFSQLKSVHILTHKVGVKKKSEMVDEWIKTHHENHLGQA